MDFHVLSRRELQALCKKNRIPANMTNVAMADALKALENVEGLAEFLEEKELNPPQSPAGPIKQSPQVARHATRSTLRKARKENKVVNTLPSPAAPASRRRVETASVAGNSELKNMTNHKKVVPDVSRTPATVSTRRRAAAPSSKKKVQDDSTQPLYKTRRSMRLLEKSMGDLTLEEKIESVQAEDKSQPEDKNSLGRNLGDMMEKEWDIEDNIAEDDKNNDENPDHSANKTFCSEKPNDFDDVPASKAADDVLSSSMGETLTKNAENAKGFDEISLTKESCGFDKEEKAENEKVSCASAGTEQDDPLILDHVAAADFVDIGNQIKSSVPHEVPALVQGEYEANSAEKPLEPREKDHYSEGKEEEFGKASDQDKDAEESETANDYPAMEEANDCGEGKKKQENGKVSGQDQSRILNDELTIEDNIIKEDDLLAVDENEVEQTVSNQHYCGAKKSEIIEKINELATEEANVSNEVHVLVSVEMTNELLDDISSHGGGDIKESVTVGDMGTEKANDIVTKGGNFLDDIVTEDSGGSSNDEGTTDSEESDTDGSTEVNSDDDRPDDSSVVSSENENASDSAYHGSEEESSTGVEKAKLAMDGANDYKAKEGNFLDNAKVLADVVVTEAREGQTELYKSEGYDYKAKEYNLHDDAKLGEALVAVAVTESGEDDMKPEFYDSKKETRALGRDAGVVVIGTKSLGGVDVMGSGGEGEAKPEEFENFSTEAEGLVNDTAASSGGNVRAPQMSPLSKESLSSQFPRPNLSANPGKSSMKKQKPTPKLLTLFVENSNKENIDCSGRKMESKNDEVQKMKKKNNAFDEEVLESLSLRQLTKKVKELEITVRKNRPVLLALPDNQV